jgi:hypothetical protein
MACGRRHPRIEAQTVTAVTETPAGIVGYSESAVMTVVTIANLIQDGQGKPNLIIIIVRGKNP